MISRGRRSPCAPRSSSPVWIMVRSACTRRCGRSGWSRFRRRRRWRGSSGTPGWRRSNLGRSRGPRSAGSSIRRRTCPDGSHRSRRGTRHPPSSLSTRGADSTPGRRRRHPGKDRARQRLRGVPWDQVRHRPRTRRAPGLHHGRRKDGDDLRPARHPHHRAPMAQARHHIRQQPPTPRPPNRPTVRDVLTHQLSEMS